LPEGPAARAEGAARRARDGREELPAVPARGLRARPGRLSLAPVPFTQAAAVVLGFLPMSFRGSAATEAAKRDLDRRGRHAARSFGWRHRRARFLAALGTTDAVR